MGEIDRVLSEEADHTDGRAMHMLRELESAEQALPKDELKDELMTIVMAGVSTGVLVGRPAHALTTASPLAPPPPFQLGWID